MTLAPRCSYILRESPECAVEDRGVAPGREGKAVKNGDLLSLGSFSALLPPKPGMTVTARYTGLTADPAEVKVTFE